MQIDGSRHRYRTHSSKLPDFTGQALVPRTSTSNFEHSGQSIIFCYSFKNFRIDRGLM